MCHMGGNLFILYSMCECFQRNLPVVKLSLFAQFFLLSFFFNNKGLALLVNCMNVSSIVHCQYLIETLFTALHSYITELSILPEMTCSSFLHEMYFILEAFLSCLFSLFYFTSFIVHVTPFDIVKT